MIDSGKQIDRKKTSSAIDTVKGIAAVIGNMKSSKKSLMISSETKMNYDK